jgi:photosystem II stability/assembly factor-like uncharacterized protein
MKRTLPLILLVSILCAALPARAASSRWTSLGPERRGFGQVLTFAFDPSNPDRAFAGLAGGGIARSGDAGRTWRSFGEGLRTSQISSVAVHPALGRLVFASDGFFLYRSLNDGRTWTTLSLREVRAVVPDPRDPNGVWAATPGGLYRSRDMGSTWERIQANLPAGYGVSALAVSPVDPRRMYITVTAPSGFGFWVSEDGGRTWVRRSRVRGVLLQADLHEARTVYLHTGSAIQRSRDAGLTFEHFFDPTTVGPPERGLEPRLLVLDPHDAATAYVVTSLAGGEAAVFRTRDAGRTWRSLGFANGLPPSSFEPTALAVNSEGTALLGLRFRVGGGFQAFRSEDGGDTWTDSSSGVVNAVVTAVTVTQDGTMFIGIPFDGVLRSTDGGRTWTRSLDTKNTVVISFATDPNDPETVYAGTRFPFGRNPHFLWKTTDGGATWTALPYPPVFEAGQTVALDANAIAVDPTDPQTLFIATELNNAGLSTWAGIFRSRDGGQTWEKVGVPWGYFDVQTHPDAPGLVLAVSALGVFRSTDHGDTWTEVLHYGGTAGTLFFSLALAPSDPDVVYALRGDGTLFRSLDAGATWTSLGRRLPSGFGLSFVVDPRDPDTIVFQGAQGPVRLTLGAGRAGRMVLDQGLLNRSVPVLYFDPNDPLRLLGGTSGAGLMEYRFQP